MVYGRDMLVLFIIFLVSSLAFDLTSPIWSIYIESSLGASMTELGFAFTAGTAVAAATQILSGILSDKYGRKRIHVLGALLAVFPPLMYALVSNWFDLVPWVMLDGLAWGLYSTVRQTMVADVTSTKTMASAYSWVNVSVLVGSTVAPFAGGVIADLFGIRFPFFASSVLMLAVFPLALLMRETRRKPHVQNRNRKNKDVDVTGTFLLTVVLFSLIQVGKGLGIGVIDPVVPIFVVSNFHVDYTFIGILYAIGFGVASIIAQIPGGKCSNLFDRRKVVLVTYVASTPFFLLFAYSRNTLELITFMFLSRVIMNLSWSPFQTLMMDSTPPKKWGLMNGISSATFFLGLLLGNAFSGILWDSWGMLAPFFASALAIGLSALPLLLLKEPRSKD
jgi:DHA1 family multidrug resistance protein-like MFS transporter